jgi:hypothetical protein
LIRTNLALFLLLTSVIGAGAAMAPKSAQELGMAREVE